MKEKHLWKVASVLIAMLMGLAMIVSCSKDDGDGNGGSSDGNLQKYVGTWEIAHSTGYRTENGEIVSQWDEDVSSEHNRIVFGADGTWTFYEYSSSRGAWHEDGKGTYYMSGDQLVVMGAMENLKIISLTTNEMVIEYEFSEDKGSVYVKKHYHDTLRRITPSSSDIYESGSNSSSNSDNGGNSSSGSGGSSGGSSSGGGSSYSNTETITCSLCNGSGKCNFCSGKGYIGSTSFGTQCFLCKGSGKCTSCDGHGYKEVTVNPNGGGSSSGGNSSGGGSSSGTKCKYCQGSGKCSNYVNSAYNKYYCLGSGDCQYCSGDGYYRYASSDVMCANCDIPGHGNTPGNGKCSYCGGSGKCSHCKGTGYQ